MELRRIALFGMKYTQYDYFMLSGLAMGFSQAGVEVVFLPWFLGADALAAFCHSYRPDAILDINRTRNHAEGLPLSVRHIAWIQDPPHHRTGQAPGFDSDLTYFISCPDMIGYAPDRDVRWGLLYTGVDQRTAFPSDSPPESDFSIVGFIPPPYRRHELYPQICPGTGRTFGAAFDAYTERYREAIAHTATAPVTHDEVMALFHASFRETMHCDFRELSLPRETVEAVEFVVITMISRVHGRHRMADIALRVSTSLRIYGPPHGWQQWPEYSPYFRGYLAKHGDVCQVLRTTRLNLHNNMNGFSMHSRVLDSMACGAPILVESSRYDDAECGIAQHFEPGVHFLPFTFDTLEDVARHWLADTASRDRMGREASRAVLAKHTWKARAQQVIKDFRSL